MLHHAILLNHINVFRRAAGSSVPRNGKKRCFARWAVLLLYIRNLLSPNWFPSHNTNALRCICASVQSMWWMVLAHLSLNALCVVLVKCIKLFNTSYNCVCVVALPLFFLFLSLQLHSMHLAPLCFSSFGVDRNRVGLSFAWQAALQFRIALNLLFYFIRDSNGIFVSQRTQSMCAPFVQCARTREITKIYRNRTDEEWKKSAHNESGNAKRSATPATEDENFSHQTFSKYATVSQFDYSVCAEKNMRVLLQTEYAGTHVLHLVFARSSHSRRRRLSLLVRGPHAVAFIFRIKSVINSKIIFWQPNFKQHSHFTVASSTLTRTCRIIVMWLSVLFMCRMQQINIYEFLGMRIHISIKFDSISQ